MSMKKLNVGVPKFDPKKAHGTIYGSGSESSVGRAAFCQNGHYYTGDGSYVGSDSDAKLVATGAEAEARPDPGMRFVLDAEIETLLQDEKAPGLLNLPLPALQAMVSRAGGPAFSGDNAPKQYVAWLLKFTKKDG